MGTALRHTHMHPECAVRLDALLWSINDRLAGGKGQDLPPLGNGWLSDLLRIDARQQAALQNEEP